MSETDQYIRPDMARKLRHTGNTRYTRKAIAEHHGSMIPFA